MVGQNTDSGLLQKQRQMLLFFPLLFFPSPYLHEVSCLDSWPTVVARALVTDPVSKNAQGKQSKSKQKLQSAANSVNKTTSQRVTARERKRGYRERKHSLWASACSNMAAYNNRGARKEEQQTEQQMSV